MTFVVTESPMNRFRSKVQIMPNGCLIWATGKSKSGYGKFYAEGSDHRAHRWYYEEGNGPIPKGLVLDHRCRDRACVNPDHLDAVTQRENNEAPEADKIYAEVG